MGYLQSSFRNHLQKTGHSSIRKQNAELRKKNKAAKSKSLGSKPNSAEKKWLKSQAAKQAAGEKISSYAKKRIKKLKITAKQKSARRRNIAVARAKRRKNK